MSNRITFDAVNTPDFRGANLLLTQGGQQYQDAIKGLTDTLKGIQTDVRSKNDALIQNYINQATAEQLQSPEGRQGFQELLNGFGNEYSYEKAYKDLDARTDVLQQRANAGLEQQKLQQGLKIGDQTLESNTEKLNQDKFTNAQSRYTQRFGLAKDDIERAAVLAEATAAGINLNPETLYAYKASQATIDNNESATKLNNFNIKKGQALLPSDIAKANADVEYTQSQTEGQKITNQGKTNENVVTGAEAGAIIALNGLGDRSPNFNRNSQSFTSALPLVGKFDTDIVSAADQYGLDKDLLRALVMAESAGNPNAQSGAGARGLGQIMPGTRNEILKEIGIDAYASPQNSIKAAAYYLSRRLKDNNGDVAKALAGYNAGQGNVNTSVATSNVSGKGWQTHLPKPQETVPYIERINDYLTIMRTGNDGKTVLYPPAYQARNGKGVSTPKFSDTTMGTLTGAANNIGTFNAGIIADRAKAMNDTTVNADTWLKDRNKLTNLGFIDGVPKSLYGLIKGEYANGQKGEIIRGVDQLTPAQQAQALESAEQAYKAGKFTNNGEFYVSSGNLKTLKGHLQNAVDSLLKGDTDKSKAYALSQIDNAVRTVVARDGVSPSDALNAMGITDDLKKAYIDSQKGKTTSTPTNQNAAKGASNIQKSQQEAKAKQYQEAKQKAEQARIAKERKDQLAKAAEDKRKKDEENRRRMGILGGQPITVRDNPFTARS